jgi:hypothetical protein
VVVVLLLLVAAVVVVEVPEMARSRKTRHPAAGID